MKKESIFYGTLFLIITNLIVKLMSLAYRGIMIRMIGAEGLGLIEMMMPFYSFLIVLSSMGIPLVISNLISATPTQKEHWTIVKTGTLLLAAISISVVVITMIMFPFFSHLIFSDQRLIPGFYILIPSVFLISVFSVLRGYFQGSHQTSFIGKSQVTEQSIRLISGIGIVSYLITAGAPIMVIIAGTALASLVAETAGGLYLFKKYIHQKKKIKGSYQKNYAQNMFFTGIPITLSRMIITLSAAIQASLVPMALLSKGATPTEAASFYGLFAGVALTVLHLPSIVTGALITPLIPSIADADSKNDTITRNNRIAKSIHFTNLSSIPILTLLFYFSEEICTLLFASPSAGPILSFLCIGGIFIYLQQPIIGILQGMNRFYRIFSHYLIADSIFIISLFYLKSTGNFSTTLFLTTFTVNNALIFLMNYIYLKRITKFTLSRTKTYVVPILGIFCGGFLMYLAQNKMMQTNITDLLSIALSACIFLFIYYLILRLCGALDKTIISFFLSRRKHR